MKHFIFAVENLSPSKILIEEFFLNNQVQIKL